MGIFTRNREVDKPPPSMDGYSNSPWEVFKRAAGLETSSLDAPQWNIPNSDVQLSRTNITPPLSYAAVQRREPDYEGPSFTMAPDDNHMQFYDRGGSYQDAPDPIRSSDFYTDGNKVHPWAQFQVAMGLAIASQEAVMENGYHVGKLLGYWHRPMYAGMQLPSIPRTNIEESESITYGSQYQVSGVQSSQGVTLASGLTVNTADPY